MRVSQPISLAVPPDRVFFAESAHAADFRMAERTDPYHKILYILAGSVACHEAGKPSDKPALAGSVLLIPAGTPHRLADEKPSTLLLLCLGTTFVSRDPDIAALWQTLTKISNRRRMLGRPSRVRLEGLWRRAMAEREHADIGGAAVASALAIQTLVLLARQPSETGSGSAEARVAAVIREVGETFYEPWDIDRAAARAGLSRRRFTELFRAASGHTFWEFLNERRLAHAARLLERGEHSVLGVMFSCGFNDLSHFYRMFRQRYGTPPKAWQKK